ncbi:MAG: metallophosphatase [Chitinophagales bacterium]
MNRRNFIRIGALTGVGALSPWPLQAFAKGDFIKLTILHTNDVHSRIEPFPANDKKYPGMGGAAARAAIIKEIRAKEEHLLLLDAGDMFQGTPYFNFFGGELEFKLMSEMGYDAATIGNHDFDAGIDGLYQQLKNANFPLLNSNYDFTDTIMEGQTLPFKIFNKGKLKIGVFGLGVELDGLVPSKLYGNTKYLDPIKVANETAKHLKKEMKCDYVVVLSHLGFEYSHNKVSDKVLASSSSNIDLILGGHTHTFLDEPVWEKNLEGEMVMINQVGWAGLILGKIEIYFHKSFNKKWTYGETVIVDKKPIGI